TLFSQTGDPISERMIFVKNPDMADLTLTSKKSTYGKRERVSFTVAAKDKGNDVEGHFSVSVIDESKVPADENNETTILTYLLLSSELRGYIEQPNYYFLQNSDQTVADLDALMLTQGYRRFTWKQLQNDRDAVFAYVPEKTLEISGTAKTAAGIPVRDMDVMLLTTNRNSMLGDRTDNNGKFRFANLPPIADSTVLSLQATGSTKTKNTTMFTLDADKPGPAVQEKKEPGLQTDVNKGMATYLSYSKAIPNTGIAQNTSYKYNAKSTAKAQNALLNDKNNYESSNLGGSGHADQVIRGDQIKNATSLSTGLSGLLHGINFVNGVPFNNVSTVFINGVSVKDPMYVILDGSPLNLGQGGIDAINPLSVQTVELLEGGNATIYGVNGGAGVLVITSRKNASPGNTSGTALGTLSFKTRGFYIAREFYSPKYENKTAGNKPDLRSTIFWIPELVTNKDGIANFEYYNSDGQGTYRVVIEGIDSNGNIGRQVYRYKVE
ncbi:MAG TPA: TonB-dependent receptor plug domain-containing protein, partial [Mucilaginibacter sp.]|nr:TonB-dependent receptor plug domain-containing protein [Mucilaginibacter sp.]